MCAFINNQADTCHSDDVTHETGNSQQNDEAHITQQKNEGAQIKFVLDSGATQHMVNDKRYFDRLENINEVQISVVKKNQNISTKQRGEISIKTFHDGDTSVNTIQNVLLVKD